MKVFDKIVDLQNELFAVRKEGKEIGLVPTMGALHEGHASLVKRSVNENGVTVVSVFLNPTQFNDQGDWTVILVHSKPTASFWRLVELIMCSHHQSRRCILHPMSVISSFHLYLQSWRVPVVPAISMVCAGGKPPVLYCTSYPCLFR